MGVTLYESSSGRLGVWPTPELQSAIKGLRIPNVPEPISFRGDNEQMASVGALFSLGSCYGQKVIAVGFPQAHSP